MLIAATLEDFMSALEQRDPEAAIEVANRALEEGNDVRSLIVDLFGPAQRDVGQNWFSGRWSVAQEHAATAIVEQVLAAISPGDARPVSRGHVAVACCEGEFHGLPARLAAAYLQSEGWRADFLGVSVPPTALVAALADERPLALLVSCSISTNLRGAMEAFGVAHGLGIPAIAGGSGFGDSSAHALALGSDGWAAGPAAAIGLLERWTRAKPVLNRASLPLYGEHVELPVRREEIIQRAMATLEEEMPGFGPDTGTAHSRMRDELGQVIDYLAAALLVDDPKVVASYLRWRRAATPLNELDRGLLGAGFGALLKAIPVSMTTSRRLLGRLDIGGGGVG